jgi:hypothetical protein
MENMEDWEYSILYFIFFRETGKGQPTFDFSGGTPRVISRNAVWQPLTQSTKKEVWEQGDKKSIYI